MRTPTRAQGGAQGVITVGGGSGGGRGWDLPRHAVARHLLADINEMIRLVGEQVSSGRLRPGMGDGGLP